MKFRTVMILAVIGVLAVLGGAMSYDRWMGGVSVEVARAKVGLVQEFVDEQAKTRLPRTYLITMPFEGRIQPITLEEGSPVKKGEVVARLVPEDLEIRVAEAAAAVERLDASIAENADTSIEETVLQQSLKFLDTIDRMVEAAQQQVKAAEAKMAFANKNLERFRTLAGRNAASAEDLNRAETSQVQAEVEHRQDILIWRATQSLQAAATLTPPLVRQYIARKALKGAVLSKERAEAQARLDQARLNLERGTMTSPIDGVILRRESVSERLLSAGSVLLEIGTLRDLEVEADVLSQRAVRVEEGQLVEINGPALGPVVAFGTIRRIFPAGFTKVSSLGVEQQRVKVVIAFDSESLNRLRTKNGIGVGYQVRVRIITAENAKALWIPRSAAFRSVTGDWRVFVVRSGFARLQPIEIGLINDEQVEITRGLQTGDLVIPAPEPDLTDGARVRPIASPSTNGGSPPPTERDLAPSTRPMNRLRAGPHSSPRPVGHVRRTAWRCPG